MIKYLIHIETSAHCIHPFRVEVKNTVSVNSTNELNSKKWTDS